MHLLELSLLFLPLVYVCPAAGDRSPTWQTVQCSQSPITDAAAPAVSRWVAADVDNAWNAAVAAWQNYTAASGASRLNMPEFISNYFNGPEGWNCQDEGNIPCSGTIQCDETKHPAGFLILNSFSSIHQIHQHYYQALQGAATSMLANLGTFTNTFAPQLPQSDDTITRDILDVFSTIVGVGSALAWNVAIKEARIFADDNYRGFAKDAFNGQVSFAVAIAKDNLPAAEAALGMQNTMSTALGSLFESWQGTESSYLQQIFSGANSTVIGDLWSLMQDGMISTVPVGIDLSSMTSSTQTIMYGQMIPSAWAKAPGIFFPFILKTGDSCSSAAPGDIAPWVDSDTATKARVCWQGNTFYVLSVNSNPNLIINMEAPGVGLGSPVPFVSLPGGTNDVLDGKAFGSITLEDMVCSSYQAYQLNNHQNGYQMPQNIDGQQTQGDLVFENGITTPGFFTLPICTSLYNTLMAIGKGQSKGGKYWPCE